MRTSIVGFLLFASTIVHAEQNDLSPGFIDMDDTSTAAYVNCITPRIAGRLPVISDAKAFEIAVAKALNACPKEQKAVCQAHGTLYFEDLKAMALVSLKQLWTEARSRSGTPLASGR